MTRDRGILHRAPRLALDAADLEHVAEVRTEAEMQGDRRGLPPEIGDANALVETHLPQDARALDVDDAFGRRRGAADRAAAALLVRFDWKVTLSWPTAAPSSDSGRPPTSRRKCESNLVSS